MSKGDWRRPSSVPKEEVDAEYERIFGPGPLNVMPDDERAELEREKQQITQETDNAQVPD